MRPAERRHFFSDMLGNRTLGVMVLAQGTFKDVGGQAFYVNKAKRLNWGVNGGRIPYLQGFAFQSLNADGSVNVTQVLQRIYLSQASLMGAYPFSTTRRVESNIGVQRISFDLEEQTFLFNRFGQLIDRRINPLDSRDAINLATVSLALVGDNSNSAFTSPVSGGRYRLEVAQAVGTENFTSVVADIRRYFSPSNSITFAARALHFGRYAHSLDTDRTTAAIQPYFLGYETLIRGYSFESLGAEECAATALEPGAVPGSCPAFDRLFGHRLGVANLEVRVPFLGTGAVRAHQLPVPTYGDLHLCRRRSRLQQFQRSQIRLRALGWPAGAGVLCGVRGALQYFRFPDPGGLPGLPVPATG